MKCFMCGFEVESFIVCLDKTEEHKRNNKGQILIQITWYGNRKV
jgi:hypothetical protein